jgi:uncharacterized Fe-S cluster-containing protein
MLHGFLERFAPAGIVVGHFAERLESKHGGYTVAYDNQELTDSGECSVEGCLLAVKSGRKPHNPLPWPLH